MPAYVGIGSVNVSANGTQIGFGKVSPQAIYGEVYGEIEPLTVLLVIYGSNPAERVLAKHPRVGRGSIVLMSHRSCHSLGTVGTYSGRYIYIIDRPKHRDKSRDSDKIDKHIALGGAGML